MWERDRKLLNAFKECMQQRKLDKIKGEEVDFAETCKDETEALIQYTVKLLEIDIDQRPSGAPEGY